jgi:DNA-binding SARP family transcriptional activator
MSDRGVLVLGPVVEADGALSPRDRAFLAALAVRRGHVTSTDALADAVWAERPPSTWPKQVQACVGRLRKVLGSAAIETTAAGYVLAIDAGELDRHRFEELVTRARAGYDR